MHGKSRSFLIGKTRTNLQVVDESGAGGDLCRLEPVAVARCGESDEVQALGLACAVQCMRVE